MYTLFILDFCGRCLPKAIRTGACGQDPPPPDFYFDIYDFFRLRNELDRNQLLLGNDDEWIIPDLFKVFYFDYLFRCSCSHAVQ